MLSGSGPMSAGVFGIGRLRYPDAVRHHIFHRWAFAFLLVSRLILGEFVHAMPHESAATDAAAASQSMYEPPCPEHSARHAATASNEVSDSGVVEATDHAGNDRDCCKSGGCACPCLHTPGATGASTLAIERAHPGLPTVLASGVAHLRSYTLFRPPA